MGIWSDIRERVFGPPDNVTPHAPLTEAGLPSRSPDPTLDDYADANGPPRSIFNIFQPSPAHLNYAFLHSDEWSRTIVRLRNEVWRRGLKVEPTHPHWCLTCGIGVDHTKDGCPNCGGREFRGPDQRERQILQQILEEANHQRESLTDVGERKTEENLKHGRGLIVFRFKIDIHADGRIQKLTLDEVKAGDPGRIYLLRDKANRPGGTHICIACRGKPGYAPESAPTRCSQCHGILYEAWYAEYLTAGAGGSASAYYLPFEVHETRWPYKDGSSPGTRLWPKITALLWMDRRSANSVAPRTDFPPEKLLVTMGGDEASIKAWMERDYAARQKKPRRFGHLHMPSPPGGLQDLKMAAEVLDLGDTVFREQQLDVRAVFEKAMHAQYHVAPMQAGDTEASGGLNNEGLQMRSTAQVAEDIQRHEVPWLRHLAMSKGVREWQYVFPPAMEEDEGRRAGVVSMHLNNARTATELGLTVKWVDGQAKISDGEVAEAINPPLPRKDDEAPAEDEDDLVSDALDASSGPSGTVEMALPVADPRGTLWVNYADLSPELSGQVNDAILEGMMQPEGWSITSIQERIRPVLETAGLPPPVAKTRARLIARMETRSIRSAVKLHNAHAEDAESGAPALWVNRGARDHRRTKLSWWIDERVGDGVPLDELLEIIDEGISLAKRGAFVAGGPLAGTRGEPIRLPADFQRRGFLAHFNDRDDYVRTVMRRSA